MTEDIPHGRFLVLTIVNSRKELIGSAKYDVQMVLNRQIEDNYGDHVVDARARLVSASKGDADTIAADWTLDGLHLARKAMRSVALLVKEELGRRGW
jgi:hypothetical protein